MQTIYQIKHLRKYDTHSVTDRQYVEILSRGDTAKRIFFQKYDLAKNFFSVWPLGRERETIIPSPGTSVSVKMSCLLFCWQPFKGPLGAPCCHRWMDPPPLVFTSPPLPRSNHPLSFIFLFDSPLSSPICPDCQLYFFKYPLWIIAGITKTACWITAGLNYSNSMLPTSSFVPGFLAS